MSPPDAIVPEAPPGASGGPERGRGLVLTVVAVGGLLTLLLHAIAPLYVAPDLWGVGTWRGVTAPWRAFLLVVSATLLLAPGRLASYFYGRPRAALVPWIVGFGLVLLFVALKAQVPWANAGIAANAAGRGEVTLKHILASAFAAGVANSARAITGVFHGDTGYIVLSSLSGAVFVPGAFALGRALFPDSLPRARAVALVLCTAGWMQMFFGVVETYTPAIPAQIWTLAWVVRLLRAPAPDPDGDDPFGERGRAGLWALFCFSVGVGIFAAVLVLGPAVALALLLRRPRRIDFAYVVVPALPIAVSVLLFLLFGRAPELAFSGVGGSDGQTWVALSRETGGRNFHFAFFSLGHLDARLETLTLSAPAWLPLTLLSLLALVLRGRELDGTRLLVLAIAAAASASYAIGVNPDMGPPMEWMQSACGIVAPYVLVVWLGFEAVPERLVGRVAAGLVVLSLVHTAPWVIDNSKVLM